METVQVRPSWDAYFMEVASVVATRSTCLRRSVGAVIVKNHRILTTGYNGSPRDIQHCSIRGCLREKLNVPSGEKHELCYAVHAEANAIIQAALHGVCISGSFLYCTHSPCVMCAKMIINAGISSVIVRDLYPDSFAFELLKEAAVPVIQL